MAIEEKFKVDVDNEEAEKITIVGDVVDIFAKHMIEKINREKLAEK